MFSTEAVSTGTPSPSRVAWIDEMVKTQKIPLAAGAAPNDDIYAKRVLFRRQSGSARVTVFAGGHEILHDAAFAWLGKHVKPASTGLK